MNALDLRKKLSALAAEVGEGYFFAVKHQPNKKLTPVRVELRRSVTGVTEPRESLSSLIGFDDTIADEEAVYEAALKVKARASRASELIGVYG